MGVGHAQFHATCPERAEQVANQLGPGEVDLGNGAEEQHDEPHGILARRQDLEHALPHVLDVEVEQRRLATDDERSGDGLVLRVARPIGVVGRSRDPAHLGHARAGGLPEQQDDGDGRAQQDAVDGARSQHAEQRRDRDEELAAAEVPDVAERADVHQAHDRREHDGGEHGLRQVAQQPGREEHDDQREQRGDEARDRRARPGALVHERLRHAAADGKSPAESRDEIAGAERQQLLIGVEAIAVLLAEHAADRGRLDRGEDEARQRHREERVQVVPTDIWQPEGGQALRHFAQQRHAAGVEIEESSSQDAGDHHEEGNRSILEPQLAGDEHRQRGGADNQRRLVRVAEMPEEIRRAFPEVPVRPLEAEQLRQLRAREIESQSRLETDQHRLGEEVDGRTRAHQPREERDGRHHDGEARRQRGVPRRIARAQFAHRRGDQERQRRGDRDDGVLRAAEQPEDEP